MRKSPIRHRVRRHLQKGSLVGPYFRGQGSPIKIRREVRIEPSIREKTVLYHITPLSEDYLRKYGLKPMFDPHIGAKEIKEGKVINLAERKDLGHLFYRFTMLPSKFTEEEPNIVEIEVPLSAVRKVHHAKYNFSWYVTAQKIRPDQIKRILPASAYTEGTV